MKRVAIFAGLLISVIVPEIRAQDAGECSISSMRGQYSFVVSGTVGGAPFSAAGYGIYDGHGNVQGVIQASSNGNVLPPTGWSGTYTVNAMTAGTTPGGPTVCVFSKTITVPDYKLSASWFFTAADSFKELRFIATTPGMTMSGTAQKE
jgi:hypothetical protein